MRRAIPAAVLLVALTGCGGEPSGSSTGTPGAVAASQPQRPRCAEVFQPGKPIAFGMDKASLGCLEPDGGVQIVGSHRCADGRHLFTVDASTGAPRGWGFDGDVFHVSAGETAADPAYGAAYRKCLG